MMKKRVSNTEKYDTIIEELNNEIESMELDKNIDTKILQNKIRDNKEQLILLEYNLIKLNKKLEKKVIILNKRLLISVIIFKIISI